MNESLFDLTSIPDGMVRLTITTAAKHAIELYNGLQSRPAEWRDDEPSLAEPEVGNPVTHSQLIEIVTALRIRDGRRLGPDDALNDRIDLETLLRGARLYTPPPQLKQAPTSEYTALMARLRKDEELRAYHRMTNPPEPHETTSQQYPNSKAFGAMAPEPYIFEEADELTYADVNRQMALIINVLVSIIACSVCIWIAARHWSTPQRLGLSMTGSTVVAVAEVAIYMGYIRRIKDAKSEETRKKEHKEIVNTWVIDGKKGGSSSVIAAGDALRFRKGKHR